MRTITEEVLIEDCTVSNLIWRKFGRQPARYIERVLDMNPGLAEVTFVPIGTKLTFPLDDLEDQEVSEEIVRMWD